MLRSRRAAPPPPAPARPELHLDGPRLARSLHALVAGSEADGGIERWVAALGFKTSLFRESLAPARLDDLAEDVFVGLCAFIAPVRRRIGAHLAAHGFEGLRERLAALLRGAEDTADADARIAAFCAAFPADRAHRWVRDLAAELLHQALPEHYPLMTRWVWDAGANTGVLREIWHGPDAARIEAGDDYETFLALRAELAGWLTANGFFRDVPRYVDLLCAQVYAEYIGEQGGAYLRTDFVSEHDPMRYTRRMLGLDGVDPSGRTRVKGADGRALVVGDAAFRATG